MARLGRKQFAAIEDGTLGFSLEWKAHESTVGAATKREEARALYALFLVRMCRTATQQDGTMVA